MANPNANPTKARMARTKKRQEAGDITAARAKLWKAIGKVEAIIEDPRADAARILKAVHALTQAVSVYCRLIEGTELEKRIEELERLAAERNLRGS